MTHFEIEQSARALRAQVIRSGMIALRRWIAARMTATPAGRTV